MKAYKGFNKDMTCRDFQYEGGKEYETEIANVCNSGFHACEHPLDCFRYYPPNNSIYHEVEQSGELSKSNQDTKIASTKIKIGASLNISDLVKAAVQYTKKTKTKEISNYYGAASATRDYGAASATGCGGAATTTGNCGAASATGDHGAASATNYYGATSATGYCGAASATGDCGAASATGDHGAASATGDCGAATTTGDCGAASATGDCGAATTTGDCGAATTTGYGGMASAGNKNAIAIAWGINSKAKGVLGSHLVLTEWIFDKDKQVWALNKTKMVQVDGEKIKPDTWYSIENGEIIEIKD